MILNSGIYVACWYYAIQVELKLGRMYSSNLYQSVVIAVIIDLIIIELVSTYLVRSTQSKRFINLIVSILKKAKLPTQDMYLLAVYEDRSNRKKRLREKEEERLRKIKEKKNKGKKKAQQKDKEEKSLLLSPDKKKKGTADVTLSGLNTTTKKKGPTDEESNGGLPDIGKKSRPTSKGSSNRTASKANGGLKAKKPAKPQRFNSNLASIKRRPNKFRNDVK